jgi:ankyrin repeat protein
MHGANLVQAVKDGVLDGVKRLFEEYSVVEEYNMNVYQAFFCAASCNELPIVRYFLGQRGFDAERVDARGESALQIAVGYQCMEVALFLIEDGRVPLNSADCFGQTALHFASGLDNSGFIGGHSAARYVSEIPAAHWLNNSLQIVESLLDKDNAVTHAVDRGNNTALHMACMNKNDDVDVVRCLIEKGQANADAVNRYGGTPLIAASFSGNWKVVAYLVRHGAVNVEARDDEGLTALMYSSASSSEMSLRITNDLVEQAHANVDATDILGRTALHRLVIGYFDGSPDYPKIAKRIHYLIVSARANTELVDFEGKTAMYHACRCHQIALVLTFVECIL